MASTSNVQLFNLDTMSGVFPGTRTKTFQRLRLQPMAQPQEPTTWAQVLWYDNPAACVVYLQNQVAVRNKVHEVREIIPLLRIIEPLVGDFNQKIQAALAQVGWQVQSCGSCRFWQANHLSTNEGLPTGLCTFVSAPAATAALPVSLATQSNLALACPHWQLAGEPHSATHQATLAEPMTPMRKAAEITESKLPYWVRMRKQWMRWGKPAAKAQDWDEKLVERSGVGAGTESCFACHGRIANLGALAVETPEGDKQTFSVWRCRSCYTTYLNDWIDRWERLENLETEEKYYRLAPSEALALLVVLDNVTDGDHPGRRRERAAERSYILNYLAGRTPLSYQIKQGR